MYHKARRSNDDSLKSHYKRLRAYVQKEIRDAYWRYVSNEPWHDKTNKMSVHPVKTQIRLDIHPVWSESLLCRQWVAKDPRFLHADSEVSDQTGQTPRLIWVFAARTLILLVLSCRSSNIFIPSETDTNIEGCNRNDRPKRFWSFMKNLKRDSSGNGILKTGNKNKADTFSRQFGLYTPGLQKTDFLPVQTDF